MPEDPASTFFRVDPRLIHATLMNAWVPELDAGAIVVADGAVARDTRRRTIYEMSAMEAVEVVFVEEAEAATALAALSSAGVRVIVLFSTLAAVETARAHGLQISTLNVGHVPKAPGREELHPAVHLGPEERACVRRLEAGGVRVLVQPLPDDAPQAPAASQVVAPPRPAAPTAPPSPELRPTVSAPVAGPRERRSAVLEVVNERGLHLRAAHVLAHLAGRLSADVEVGFDGVKVNAKSLLGLTTLGAGLGSRLEVVVDGPGAAEGMEAIRDLFASGFGEGVSGGEAAT